MGNKMRTASERIAGGETKMAFIIAIAIYDGGIDVAVPTFLLGLVVWYGVLFESGLADADDILGI